MRQEHKRSALLPCLHAQQLPAHGGSALLLGATELLQGRDTPRQPLWDSWQPGRSQQPFELRLEREGSGNIPIISQEFNP